MAPTQGPSRVQRFLDLLTRQRKQSAYVFFGVSAVLAGLALWAGLDSEWKDGPEIFGAALLALAALGAALWQLAAPPERATVANTRILVLALGGVSGLIIAVATLARA